VYVYIERNTKLKKRWNDIDAEFPFAEKDLLSFSAATKEHSGFESRIEGEYSTRQSEKGHVGGPR